MTARPRRPRRRGNGPLRWRAGWLAVALIATSITGASVAGALAQSQVPEPELVTDFTIVSGARVLSDDEIAAAEITDTDRGRSLVDAHVRDTSDPAATRQRTYAAYDFGEVTAVLDTTTPFKVIAGSNGVGQQVQEVVPSTIAVHVPDAVDAAAMGLAWSHVQDASATIFAGECWKRVLWWTVNAAPGTFDDGPGAAFRVYGRVNASPRGGAGCDDSEGFRRAWIEFSPGSDGQGVQAYEPAQPEHHIGGGGDPPIRSIGFGPIYSTDLGTPPVRPDGSADQSYGGVIDQRWAAWRALSSDEPAGGGVRWCLFFDHPTPATVSFATRVSGVVPAGGVMGSVDIVSSQDAGWESCPPPD